MVGQRHMKMQLGEINPWATVCIAACFLPSWSSSPLLFEPRRCLSICGHGPGVVDKSRVLECPRDDVYKTTCGGSQRNTTKGTLLCLLSSGPHKTNIATFKTPELNSPTTLCFIAR
ncbi:hypothetical protein FPOAC2_01545 [Fusarium poae]